jgi:hypothetical protein
MAGCTQPNVLSQENVEEIPQISEEIKEELSLQFPDFWVCEQMTYRDSSGEYFETKSSKEWIDYYSKPFLEDYFNSNPDLGASDVLIQTRSIKLIAELPFMYKFEDLSSYYLVMENKEFKELFKEIASFNSAELDSEQFYNRFHKRIDAVYIYCAGKNYFANRDEY